MRHLESILADLERLSPPALERAAAYVRSLASAEIERRNAILDETHGALSAEEAAELEDAIERACERVDEAAW